MGLVGLLYILIVVAVAVLAERERRGVVRRVAELEREHRAVGLRLAELERAVKAMNGNAVAGDRGGPVFEVSSSSAPAPRARQRARGA